MMVWVYIVVGAALLLFGRKLYWLFIGGIGFIGGLVLASIYFKNNAGQTEIFIALGCGVAGILLAIFIQKSAVWFIGFLAGGFLALSLLRLISVDIWFIMLIAFIMGGFLGALLTSVVFEWALVFLSSGIGAVLITQVVKGQPQSVTMALLAGLFLLGVIVQRVKKKNKVITNQEAKKLS
jgi:hypothetical protein